MPSPPLIDLGSGIDTQDIIRKLIEIERQPLSRIEQDKQIFQLQVQVWQELRQLTENLADKSKELYSLARLLRESQFYSSEPSVVTGKVASQGGDVKAKLIVQQLASPQVFHSKPLNLEDPVPAGSLSVTQNTQSKTIRYDGGTVADFKAALDSALKGMASLSIRKLDANKHSIQLSSDHNGVSGRLRFEDPNALLISLGLTRKHRERRLLNFRRSNLRSIPGYPSLRYSVDEKRQVLELSQGKLRFDLDQEYENKRGSRMHLSIKAKKARPYTPRPVYIGEEAIELDTKISVQVDTIMLSKKPKRSRPRTLDPVLAEAPKPSISVRLTASYSHKGKKYSRSFSRKFQEAVDRNWYLSLNGIPESAKIHQLRLESDGTIEIADSYIEGPIELIPVHERSPGKDAIVKVDGIPQHRTQNENLTDLVQGASIDLLQTSTQNIDIEVKRDTEDILGRIREWVQTYNQALSFLKENMKTSQELGVRASGVNNRLERLQSSGVFATDTTARQLYNNIRFIANAVYPKTDSKASFRSLVEIGISTGALGDSSEKLRSGILEIDEEQLGQSLAQSFTGVRKLFASDTDADLKIDNGVAYKMENTLRPYAQKNKGLISIRIENLEASIKSQDDRIYEKELALERKEEILRRRFGRMGKRLKQKSELTAVPRPVLSL